VLTEHACKIAPNSYWVAKERPRPPAPSGTSIKGEIGRVWAENLEAYGAG